MNRKRDRGHLRLPLRWRTVRSNKENDTGGSAEDYKRPPVAAKVSLDFEVKEGRTMQEA